MISRPWTATRWSCSIRLGWPRPRARGPQFRSNSSSKGPSSRTGPSTPGTPPTRRAVSRCRRCRLGWSHPARPRDCGSSCFNPACVLGVLLMFNLDRRARGASLAAVMAVLAVLGGVVLTTQSDRDCLSCGWRPLASSRPQQPPRVPNDGETGGRRPGCRSAGRVLVTAQTGGLSDVTMVNGTARPSRAS